MFAHTAGVKLSIIIPCYNEAATIARVIEKVRGAEFPAGWDREVIVVDDFSTDGTRELLRTIAERGDIELVLLEKNSGKGGAVKSGLAKATGDYVIIQDADEEYDPKDIALLLVATSKADSVFGSRNLGTNNVPFSKVFFYGGLLVTKLFNILFGTRLSDVATCYKLFPRRFIPVLAAIEQNDFTFDAVYLTRALVRGGTIVEVPISYRARTKAEGKKLSLKHGISIAAALVRARISK